MDFVLTILALVHNVFSFDYSSQFSTLCPVFALFMLLLTQTI